MNEAGQGAALEAAGRAFDLGELSPAERRVLQLALEGLSVREMTQSLVLSEATVRSHLGRIYGKLGVRGRVELLARVAEASARPIPGAEPRGSLGHETAARSASPDEIAKADSLAPILVALVVVLLVTFIMPLVAIVTVPGLLLAGLLGLRAQPGSRERRAVPWVFAVAVVAVLWIAVASAVFVGVSSPTQSEFLGTGVPGESPGP